MADQLLRTLVTEQRERKHHPVGLEDLFVAKTQVVHDEGLLDDFYACTVFVFRHLEREGISDGVVDTCDVEKLLVVCQ